MVERRRTAAQWVEMRDAKHPSGALFLMEIQAIGYYFKP
jgi:hypothetical protein